MNRIACGFTANIDLLGKITPEFYEEMKLHASGTPEAVIDTWEKFCIAIDWNMKRGSGAEYIVSNQEILTRLEQKLSWDKAIGGTGLQAGCAASCAGYKAIVNLPVYSEELESIVSEYEELVLLSDEMGEVPKHYILEYEYGNLSNRIIFRKNDEFAGGLIAEQFLKALNPDIGWLLLSGYNAFDRSEEIELFLHNTVQIIKSLGKDKPKIHLELASIWSLEEQWKIIKTLQGHVDSIGLNEDEFQELFGMEDHLLSYEDHQFLSHIDDACQVLGVPNLVLHTKEFSLIKSEQFDTALWSQALENGNKLAFARAMHGKICDQRTIEQVTASASRNPRGERLKKLTDIRKDVTVSPSFVGKTTSTIGLGDTFNAGLLVEAPVEFVPLRELTL